MAERIVGCGVQGPGYASLVSALVAAVLASAPALAQHEGARGSAITLSGAIAAALSASPDVHVAQEQVDQADARVGEAKAQQRLQFSLNSALSGSDAVLNQPPPEQEQFGAFQNTISTPLPFGARPRLALAQARRQRDASRAQYESARRALAGTAITDYYDVLQKEQLLAAARQATSDAQRQLDEVMRRNRAGDAPDVDVLRAQSPVDLAQAAEYAAVNALTTSRETLNSLMGRELDSALLLDLADIGPGAPITTMDDVREDAVRNSAEVAAAKDEIEAAQAAAALARAGREPAYSAQVSDTRSGDITAFSRQDTIQFSVTIPIGDDGLVRDQAREADAQTVQAQLQAETARRAAELAASSAFLTSQAAQRQADAEGQALAVAQTAYDKTLKGYDNGLFALTDVLSAQTALAAARAASVQATISAAAASKQVELAAGKIP